jgi:hypothetical protein
MPPIQTDSPLAPSDCHMERIRVRAYHMWEREGCPDGQAAEYWERAQELDAIKHNRPAPLPDALASDDHRTADGVLIEEASLQENLGEFPGRFTDQGDMMPTPESRGIAREYHDGAR